MYRRVKIQDMPQLIEMENEFFDVDSTCHDVKECCEKENGFIYISNNDILAYILYKENVLLPLTECEKETFTHIGNDMSCGYIVSLCVRKKCQGQGIGKNLLNLVPLSGPVFLHVKKNNLNAVKLYEKCNFFSLKQEQHFFKNDVALIMYNPKYENKKCKL